MFERPDKKAVICKIQPLVQESYLWGHKVYAYMKMFMCASQFVSKVWHQGLSFVGRLINKFKDLTK